MRALDLAAGLIIASVVVVCVGAVVMSAREVGRGTGRKLTGRAAPPSPPARAAAVPVHHRRAGHPPPDAARRRERVAMRPRRRG